MELGAMKASVEHIRAKFAFTERRACRLLLVPVSSYRYQPRQNDNSLRERLIALAREKPRFGYRRLHGLLGREGEQVNHKRVHRIYREAGLALRRKKRKHCVRLSTPLGTYTAANQEWAMDFVVDSLATGRMVRILTVVDAYTRECVALEADFSLGSGRVTRVLERAIGERGRPENLRSDNVLIHEGKVREKRRSLSLPYGTFAKTVTPSGFHEQGLSTRP
jgi:putative transposase